MPTDKLKKDSWPIDAIDQDAIWLDLVVQQNDVHIYPMMLLATMASYTKFLGWLRRCTSLTFWCTTRQPNSFPDPFISISTAFLTSLIAGFHLTSWRPCWCILNKRILIISFVWDTNMAAVSSVFCVSWDCVKTKNTCVIINIFNFKERTPECMGGGSKKL